MRRAALAILLLSSRALADDAADIAAARELGVAGVTLADAGKCDEALDKLARAEKLHHAPTILGRLGECQVQLGKLVDGTENLQKVVREELAPNAPAAFVAAKARAQKVLAEAQPKIAKLTIVVKPETAAVSIDGATISSASVGTPRPIDPGAHEIEASAPGYKRAKTSISLTTSQVASMTLELEPEPKVEPTPSPLPPPPMPEPPPTTTKAPAAPPAPPPKPPAVDRTPAFIALGIGVAGIAAGTTFGILALNRKGALDAKCIEKRCPPEDQRTLDAAKNWASYSTFSFAIGAAGAAVGTVLLFNSPSEKRATARIEPTIGLGTIGLRGEF